MIFVLLRLNHKSKKIFHEMIMAEATDLHHQWLPKAWKLVDLRIEYHIPKAGVYMLILHFSVFSLLRVSYKYDANS